MVAEFVGSGMRRSEFCQSRDLSFSTLDRHLKKRRWKRRRRRTSSAGRLVPVELASKRPLTQHEPSCGLAVVLPGGHRIEVQSCEPLSGHLFLFCNAQRNRLKVLVWDGSGLWVCAKRLEKGRFTWPQSGDAHGKVVLSHEELSLLLGGIDLTKAKHKRWYRKTPPEGNAAA